MNVTIYYIVFLIGAIVVSMIANQMMLRFSTTLGIRNKNDVIVRWSSSSKPSLGGISLYFTFIIFLLTYAISFPQDDIFEQSELVGLIAAGTLAFGIGVADDAYNTKPFLKLMGQITCGIILVAFGNSITFFHHEWYDGVLTVFWVVAVMNSLNMLDNMDGIAGTVSFFIILSCLVCSFFLEGGITLNIWAMIMIVELGALIGFLSFNIHPSKMFMGDTGSQFIALFVAFFGTKIIWNIPATFEIPSWVAILLVMTVFSPTIVDTLVVVINRTKRGVSVMTGGKDHTTHHLVYKGYSDIKVWYIFLIVSVFSTIYGVLLSYLVLIGLYSYSWLGLLFFLSVFIPLYINTKRYHPPL